MLSRKDLTHHDPPNPSKIVSAIPLKASQKHIGLKTVGMAGWCWMIEHVNDKLKEREEVR